MKAGTKQPPRTDLRRTRLRRMPQVEIRCHRVLGGEPGDVRRFAARNDVVGAIRRRSRMRFLDKWPPKLLLRNRAPARRRRVGILVGTATNPPPVKSPVPRGVARRRGVEQQICGVKNPSMRVRGRLPVSRGCVSVECLTISRRVQPANVRCARASSTE